MSFSDKVHFKSLVICDAIRISHKSRDVGQYVFFTFTICWTFHHVFVTCWRVRSCSTEVPRKKASMDPLRISIKLQWTHEFSPNLEVFWAINQDPLSIS